MNYLTELKEVNTKSANLALATSIDNIPNVRIVTFVWKEETPNILYFATGKDNKKIQDIIKNSNVAFTTIPNNPEDVPHLRSNDAIVKKSKLVLTDLSELFIQKLDSYQQTIDVMGDILEIYEIEIKNAILVASYDKVIPIQYL